MIEMFTLMAFTALMASWISFVVYDQYHGGGFSTWLQWYHRMVRESWLWWLLLAGVLAWR